MCMSKFDDANAKPFYYFVDYKQHSYTINTSVYACTCCMRRATSTFFITHASEHEVTLYESEQASFFNENKCGL